MAHDQLTALAGVALLLAARDGGREGPPARAAVAGRVVVSAEPPPHERLNGSGYPKGLEGDEIPLVGRIAVADVFDAVTTSRPYEKAWAFDAGLANLREEAGKLYDAECVEAFSSIQEAVREVATTISH